MGDTAAFDTAEQANVLIKTAFGFPSTNENREWYEEIAVPFNNYFFGDEILVEEVPAEPDFNTNGTALTAAEIGLTNDDFVNYTFTTNLSECSIVEDSTRKVRRFKGLKLDSVLSGLNPATGEKMSYYKTAKETTDLITVGTNLLMNGLQMNYKQVGAYTPYKYDLYSTKTGTAGNGLTKIILGNGSWFIDLKSGVLLFNDINQVGNLINDTDVPVLDPYYVYVGKKGLSNFISTTSNSTTSTSNTSSNGITNITQAFQTSAQSGAFIGYRSSADEIYGIDVDPSNAIIVGKSSIIGENDVVKTDVSYVDVLYNDEPSLIKIKLTESPEFTDTSQQYTGYFDTSFVTVTSLSGINVNDGIVIPTIDYWNAFRFDFDISGDGWDVFKGSIIPFYFHNTFRYTETVEYNTVQYQWNYINTTSPTVYNDLSWNYVPYTQEAPDKFKGWNVPFPIQNIHHTYSRNFIESIDATNKRLYLKFSNFSYPYTGRQLQITIITLSEYVVDVDVNYSLPFTVEDDEIITANTTQTLKNKTIADAFNTLSDTRIKNNEIMIENATQSVMKLRPKTYDLYEDFQKKGDPYKSVGLLVQDVYYLAPELRNAIGLCKDRDGNVIMPSEIDVSTIDQIADEDYNQLNWGSQPVGIKYDYFIPYLIKMNQEQQDVIENLKSRLEALENAGAGN